MRKRLINALYGAGVYGLGAGVGFVLFLFVSTYRVFGLIDKIVQVDLMGDFGSLMSSYILSIILISVTGSLFLSRRINSNARQKYVTINTIGYTFANILVFPLYFYSFVVMRFMDLGEISMYLLVGLFSSLLAGIVSAIIIQIFLRDRPIWKNLLIRTIGYMLITFGFISAFLTCSSSNSIGIVLIFLFGFCGYGGAALGTFMDI